MKQEAGWGAAALVIAAAVGLSSIGVKPATESGSGKVAATAAATSAGKSASAFAKGPCGELEERFQHFFLVDEKTVAAPDSCFLGAKHKNSGGDLQEKAAGLRVIIATLPDPLHTHLSLVFDRTTDAIQQAAADEQYVYDSSWLPWDTKEDSYALLKDKDDAEDRKKRREDQPGVLLFRGSLGAGDASEPFRNGLIVFVVGEEPTGGIHRRQFENAVQWVAALQPHTAGSKKAAAQRQVQILGPSFSGSFPSLAELLEEHSIHSVLHNRAGRDASQLDVFSGNISSEHGVEWFESAAGQPGLNCLHLHFHSSQESDEMAMGSYMDFLSHSGYDLRKLAVVSEDETAFGAEYAIRNSVVSSGPAYFYYPRDISALRAAYQNQSIFNQSAKSATSEPVRRTLQTDLADPEGDDHDTIRSYSASQTALSQEADLQQVVSMLRAHSSQYILLRSSNPLDQLFLSHFFKLEYPEARVIIVGADMLLRRETGASGLNGTMTLSSYPLLPWGYDWTKATSGVSFHGHRGFSEDSAEGSYVAARFLLHGSALKSAEEAEARFDYRSPFLPFNFDPAFDLRDYSPPFWSRRIRVPGRPLTWLSVLGNDGFWPIAALDEPLTIHTPDFRALQPEKTMFSLKNEVPAEGPWYQWATLPLSLKLLLAAMLLFSIFHGFCCCRPSLTVKPGHRAHFVRVRPRSRQFLVLLGSTLLASFAITVWWGCGGMSKTGMPMQKPTYCRIAIVLTWAFTGFGTVANRTVESWLCTAGQAAKTKAERWRQAIGDSWISGAGYLACSAIYYMVLKFTVERSLDGTNRIPTYWRCIHLTSGVSPLVPLLTLLAGLYGWFWYTLQGSALFGDERARLPRHQQISLLDANKKVIAPLRMLSDQYAAQPIERLCRPFSCRFSIVFCTSVVCIICLTYALLGNWLVRSLGAVGYSKVYCSVLVVAIGILLASAWQIFHVWLLLRHMLLFLDRLPLRRTMEALKGFSWGSIWSMSGNILDVRYKLIYRQFESMTHLGVSLEQERKLPLLDRDRWCAYIENASKNKITFANWYGRNWYKWRARDLSALVALQRSIATTAAMMLKQVLIPAWREESRSLVLSFEATSTGKEKKDKSSPEPHPASLIAPHIQNAEELVCLVYMGFIQNILGRMRSMVTGIICLFLSITVAVSSYPFDPRPFLSGAVIVLFLIVGVVVVTVYAQMHRDTTLSHLTDTNPGELGSEFWIKLIGFGVGPVLGVVTSVFPEFASFFFSFLQPGMASIK